MGQLQADYRKGGKVIDIIGKSSFERVVEDGAKVNMNWESYRLRRA